MIKEFFLAFWYIYVNGDTIKKVFTNSGDKFGQFTVNANIKTPELVANTVDISLNTDYKHNIIIPILIVSRQLVSNGSGKIASIVGSNGNSSS